MTDEVNTESVEDTGGDDNALIKSLRAELKSREQAIKELEANKVSRSEVEADVRAVVARELAIERELVSLGQPPAVRKLIQDSLDGDVTAEAVAEAVAAQGFQVTTPEPQGEGSDLEKVTSLGTQVQAAASGTQKQSLGDRIASAESAAEVAAIMAEAEAAQ